MTHRQEPLASLCAVDSGRYSDKAGASAFVQ